MATQCPKCQYIRSPEDLVPDWQCPSCGIAYQKYESYLARAQLVATPRTVETGDTPVQGDGSIWALVVTNLLAMVMAIVDDWLLVDMVFLFWIQSVMIGASYFVRILMLEVFN